MKMIVLLLILYGFTLALAIPDDPSQIKKYDKKINTFQLDAPKESITAIENHSNSKENKDEWEAIPIDSNNGRNEVEIKNLMTHIVHDLDGSRPRCYGPSCQDGFNSEEEEGFSDYIMIADKLRDYRDLPKDRLQAISALAAKLKKEKLKLDRFTTMDNQKDDDDANGKVYTTWNRMKVKQHKHPYDDKDGWVTLEPVAWSTSKISKWKPNVKKQKPNHWNVDDRFSNDDRFSSNQESDNYNFPQKRPTLTRPGYINNKLHVPLEYEAEIPSKPSWGKPQQATYPSPSSWASDEGRRPHKPNCDSQENYSNDDTLFYGMSDSLVTDHHPPNFPHEYEALHQSASSSQKRPYRRPAQVYYSNGPEYDNDRISRPPYGDGQWVLLSTTKGYKNKKRQRSLNPPDDDRSDASTMTSHQAVALTVLPVDKARTNMTTSHGGLLEVEKSFQTVEESKRDMDEKKDLEVPGTQIRPVKTQNRVIKRTMVTNVSPDSATLLAAVGAGMVPATMAMVVPMMLGRRRRREINRTFEDPNLDKIFHKYR